MKILNLLAAYKELWSEDFLEALFWTVVILVILIVGISDPVWWVVG